MYPVGELSPNTANTALPASGMAVAAPVEMNSRTVDSLVRPLKSGVISPGNGL